MCGRRLSAWQHRQQETDACLRARRCRIHGLHRTGNPVNSVKRPMTNNNESSTPALGDSHALAASMRRRRRHSRACATGRSSLSYFALRRLRFQPELSAQCQSVTLLPGGRQCRQRHVRLSRRHTNAELRAQVAVRPGFVSYDHAYFLSPAVYTFGGRPAYPDAPLLQQRPAALRTLQLPFPSMPTMDSAATLPFALHLATRRCDIRRIILTGLPVAGRHPTLASSHRTSSRRMRTGPTR